MDNTAPPQPPNIRLLVYLATEKMKQADFAAQSGVSTSKLSRIINGLAKPSVDDAFSIERETCGAIPAESWATK
jgi:transcriptional regulator with XRE-family HTH domain